MANLIVEKCGWNIEAITNTLSLILQALASGFVEKRQVETCPVKELFICENDKCILSLSRDDIRNILATFKDMLDSALDRVLKDLSIDNVLNLVQTLYDLSIEGISTILDSKLRNLTGPPGVIAQINETLASMLYADLQYEQASQRFRQAAEYYKQAGQIDRALFTEAFSNVAMAEKLKEEASRLHEENKHTEEEELIKQASKLYAESSTLFRKCSATIPEALINAILSKCDAYEVLANYYFTHGLVDEAEKYYNLCVSELRLEYIGLSEEHRRIVELKERTCRAFLKLCRAIIEQKMELYEEAGDEFRELVKERYVEDVMVELAAIAYKGALDLANTLDDILRIYPKYIELVSLYTDRVVQEKYGSFDNFIRELKVRPLASISKDVRIDEYALKMYIAFKMLSNIVKEMGLDTVIVLELLTLVAGLGLDPLTTSGVELRMEVSRSNIEVNKEKLDLMCKILDEYHKRVMEILFS